VRVWHGGHHADKKDVKDVNEQWQLLYFAGIVKEDSLWQVCC
jgi:hypothetical protein